MAGPAWTNLVFNLGVMAASTAAAGLLARGLRLPSLLGFIAAGLLLGPVFHLVREDATSAALGELGVAFLLFFVGLEMSVAEVRHVGVAASVAATVQMAVSFAAALGLALLLGFPWLAAVVLAVALAFSSTVVAVRTLAEAGALRSVHGRAAVGVLLVQDVGAILALAFVQGLVDDGPGRGFAVEALVGLVALAALLAGALFVASRAMPPFLAWVHRPGESNLVVPLAFLLVLVVGAQLAGLSPESGAFVAGVALAQLPYRDELRRRVSPLLTFAIAFFFVLQGVNLEVARLPALIVPILAFAALSLLLKPVVFTLVLPRVGVRGRSAVAAGMSLATTSEFGLVLVAAAVPAGLVSPDAVTVVAAVALLTMAVGSVLQVHGGPLAVRISRAPWLRGVLLPRRGREAGNGAEETPDGHVIVIGGDLVARRLVEGLHEREVPTTLVSPGPPGWALPPSARLLYGSPEHTEILDEADFRKASLVVSTYAEPGLNEHLLEGCRGVVPFACRAESLGLARRLEAQGAAFAVVPAEAAAAPTVEAILAKRRAAPP